MAASIINFSTSLLVGFAVFSVLGYMANQTGQSVANSTESGAGLAFIAYSQSLATMAVSPMWSILFFAMLMRVGFDSQCGTMKAIFTGLQNEFPFLKKTHFIDVGFKTSFQILLFFFGIPLVSKVHSFILTVK